jgi:putative photosynthetic complex assembly protein 2
VPNISDELLPPHLTYLKSYFGRPRFNAWIGAVAGWLARARRLAGLARNDDRRGRCGLAVCARGAGALEHLFLALPLRDGALWRWAIPARRRPA